MLLCTYNTAGAGIELTAARHCLLLNYPGTQDKQLQALARIRRIGQEKKTLGIIVGVDETPDTLFMFNHIYKAAPLNRMVLGDLNMVENMDALEQLHQLYYDTVGKKPVNGLTVSQAFRTFADTESLGEEAVETANRRPSKLPPRSAIRKIISKIDRSFGN